MYNKWAFQLHATFEQLTGPKGLKEPEATLEPRVHECMRHSPELYCSQFTYIWWCDIIPPWLGKEHSNCLRVPEATLEPRVPELRATLVLFPPTLLRF